LTLTFFNVNGGSAGSIVRMLVAARGFEFEVFVEGPPDSPVVLLLHGFPQHAGEWDRVGAELRAAGLRTVALNQRGYSPGARPADPAAYAQSECIADALAVMDALGVDRFHVVGHDWGAGISWGIAEQHPDRTLSLTAISVPHFAALAEAFRDEHSDQRGRSSYMPVFAKRDRATSLLLADDAQRLKALYAGSGMSDTELDRYVAPMRDPEALRAALSWYTAFFSHPPAPMGPVSVPTTYLWSDGDFALGPDAAAACERFVTGDYRFVALEGVSHWIPDQAPAATTAAVIDRVRSIA
jgi:pimeloyl-ACP methyl ester carboxylesterase